MHKKNSFLLFSGSSCNEFSENVAKSMNVQLGNVLIEAFPDGEIGVQILENVRGRDVFVIQTIARRPNHYLMELLVLIDALKRASAGSIGVAIPYFGYARQDRKDKGRVPITAKLVANLLEKAGASRVLTMDLHAQQIQGFFDIPVDNLYARPVLVEALRKKGLGQCVVVAPDVGSIKVARAFAKWLDVDLAIVDKRRDSARSVSVETLIGDVTGRDVLLVDDMCSTGGTLIAASRVCRQSGASRIFAAVTHGLMLSRAIEDSEIEKILISDTVPADPRVEFSKVETVSVAPLFGQAIESTLSSQSISSLFAASPSCQEV